ncbi:MarR family transcriptional regulator [Metabacillus sp. GX 13764]|uniref:MarR family winged helix-turn-helix transcriptional regulator n=1 Tax=Metabacillus kandeliae TaxID=2900151 RepID=UPI001E30A3A7|nr:MarR family transcriptional regulator [Metabacillus kandeliae]MCD7035659.1 MarR family transcriptional regulator [Metabacillus kandeliae]
MSAKKQSIDRIQAGLHTALHNIQPEMLENFQQQGVTPTQLMVLGFIKKSGKCKVSQLVDLMEVKPSAVTFMVDRLEQNGFVQREHDTKDRRVVNISLTDCGEDKLRSVMDGRKAIMERYLTCLSDEELESFAGIAEKLASVAPAGKETAENCR